jgi:hypothetical protein
MDPQERPTDSVTPLTPNPTHIQTKHKRKKRPIHYVSAALFVAMFAFIGTYLLLSSRADAPFAGTITNFTNPRYLTGLPFGTRSFYDQPSRAYMNTVPATTLLNAVGINYETIANTLPQSPQIFHLLADSGIKRDRISINWNAVDYNDQTQLAPGALSKIQQDVGAMKTYGIRPLIVLEAYNNGGSPNTAVRATFTTPPKIGDKTVQVDNTTAAQIIPGLSGFDRKNQTMGIIFTAIHGNSVTLSRPIDKNTILNGKIRLMRYAPFQKPFLADGKTPNPAFTASVNGWVQYVKTISTTVKNTLGSDQFDLEVWNELTSNEAFLNADGYYSTLPDAGYKGNSKPQILAATGTFITNPANGFTDVRVTNGFASQTPGPSATTNPVGVTALSKHLYAIGQHISPQNIQEGATIKPLNALLQAGVKSTKKPYVDSFAPNAVFHYPEATMSGLITETMARDMSPITTTINGTPHGTNATNAAGQKSQVWETEWNLSVDPDPQGLQPTSSKPKKNGKASYTWDQTDLKYIQAKSDIRYLSSFVNKGLSNVYFYSATSQGELGMVDPSFVTAATQNPTVYPGDAAGGEIMQVLQRFTHAFAGAQSITQPRQLNLQELDDYSGNIQFKGNGTSQYPNLYDRDMFGFFPYQVTNSSFMIPVYVQTLDIEKIYDKNAPGETKFDMPPETYRLTIGGIHGDQVSTASLYDPLTNASPAVKIIAKDANDIVVEVPVTDSPRLLSITDSCSTQCTSNGNGQTSSTGTQQAPTVNFTAPAPGATVSGTAVALQVATTTDPSTTVANVQYRLNGTLLSKLVGKPPFSYSWNTKQLADGPYTLTATVQDGTGATVTSPPITVLVHNSKTAVKSFAAPTVTLDAPLSGATVTGKVNLDATATTDPSVMVNNVQYQLDGDSLGGVQKDAPYAYSWNTNKVAKGSHTLTATVRDTTGTTAVSKPVTVIVK